MDSKGEANTKERKYPGFNNYRGLLIECTLYAFGTATFGYLTYRNIKNKQTSKFTSVLGLIYLSMLYLKTDIMFDLVTHMKNHPELYPQNVPAKDMKQDVQD
jgi:hypothetical protein